MELQPGTSDAVIRENIGRLINHGWSVAQANRIAHQAAGKYPPKPKPKKVRKPHLRRP